MVKDAPGLIENLRSLLVLAEKTLRARLAYRAAVLVELAEHAAAYGIFLIVWVEVYRANPDSMLVSKAVMMPYLVVAFLINFALSMDVEHRFITRLRMGLVTSDLIRPLGYLGFQAGQGLGDVFGNLLTLLPVALVGYAFLGEGLFPAGGEAGLLALLSMALAFAINFSISYLVMQLGFVTMSLYGVWFMRMALHQVFSGLAVPLAMFPEALKSVALWMPFHHIIETPVLIWLGQAQGAQAWNLLAQQALWATCLLGLGVAIFNTVLSRHQVQGG